MRRPTHNAIALVAALTGLGVLVGLAACSDREPAGDVRDHAVPEEQQELLGDLGYTDYADASGAEPSEAGLVLRDTAGAVVVRVARLGATYQLGDLAGGRVTLGQVTIDTPTVSLVERPSGRLNLEEVLGIGAVGGPAGPSPLVAFRDVVIRDGTIEIRTRLSPGDSAPVVDSTAAGRFRVRRVDGLNAGLSYLRLASPLPVT